MAKETLSSSDARDAILSRHDELRWLVTETVHCAEGATGSDWDFEPLRVHARELFHALRTHMDFEERLLATALRDVIGCGAALQAEIEDSHEKLRATLASAMSSLDTERVPPARLAENIRAFADVLLSDLTTEEKYLLNADLDAIATDSQGG